MTYSKSAVPPAVSRCVWTRASSSDTSSSQPLARIRSRFRLRVESSSWRRALTSDCRIAPRSPATASRAICDTVRPNGRRASSYSLVTTRVASRRRVAMHPPTASAARRLVFSVNTRHSSSGHYLYMQEFARCQPHTAAIHSLGQPLGGRRRAKRLLADAKSTEDPVQQVVGVHRSDHFAELIECTAEFERENLCRFLE